MHRWAVAVELEIKRLPVEMIYEPPEPVWGWTWWVAPKPGDVSYQT